ncbi:divergent polysaccharide deacetylase family protein [Lentilitoribacter sp. EG35]|uniref:divergent polysaccharide deacetylase family protein n=1 Tax=Lentilitoribacter sp. EG35 TaxID=3234192 RepID=UPI00345F6D0D
MQSDLHRPLGQDKKKKKAKTNVTPASLKPWLAGFAILALIIGSAYTSFINPPLKSATPEKPEATASTEGEPTSQSDNIEAKQSLDTPNSGNNSFASQSGTSGGNIETFTTDEGLKVTKITPRPRIGDDAVFLDAPNKGQNLRIAHLPDPEIIEDTSLGRLPIYSNEGKRAFDVYARPWSGARGTRIAIVVGGLGLSQTGSNFAIETLPEEITLAFAASGNSLHRWMQDARRNGHEILLQVPFEPFDYPNNDPGRGTLLVDKDPKANLKLLHEAMGSITNYTGISNFMGARFLSDPEALEPIMRDLARRGVMFFDDGTSSRSLTETFSNALGIPFAASDMVLDTKLEVGTILKKLDDLERVAQRNGSAIGIASAFPESVEAIASWSNEAKARGIEIVGISALADDPERR